jgi:hypothetical protein
MKVRLWVPSVDEPNWLSVLSWINTEWPEGCQHDFVRSAHGELCDIWNNTVAEFLTSDCDYLWSVHSDIEYKPGTLKRLLSWDKPLVSALMFMKAGSVLPHIWEGRPEKGPGYLPHLRETFRWFFMNHMEAITHGSFIIEPRPGDALTKIDFSSTSCVLIHRKVLEAIEPPWFVADVTVKAGLISRTAAAGEDRVFFEKAAAAGFEGYVDRSCIVGHLQINVPVGVKDFAAYMTAWDPEGKDLPMMISNMGYAG